MAYGKIKADAIIRDNGGSDEEITMATIVGLDSGKASLTGATFTGDVTLNAQQELRLADSDSSNYVALKSPATVASNVTLTLPANDGDADQYLQTNGSGVLTWAGVAGGLTWTDEVTWDGSHRWESIPDTVTQVVIVLKELYSGGGTQIQIGSSGGWATSGYETIYGYHASTTRVTDNFQLYSSTHFHSGICVLRRGGTDNNEWVFVAQATMRDTSNNVYHMLTEGWVDLGANGLTKVDMSGTSGSYSGKVQLGYM